SPQPLDSSPHGWAEPFEELDAVAVRVEEPTDFDRGAYPVRICSNRVEKGVAGRGGALLQILHTFDPKAEVVEAERPRVDVGNGGVRLDLEDFEVVRLGAERGHSIARAGRAAPLDDRHAEQAVVELNRLVDVIDPDAGVAELAGLGA